MKRAVGLVLALQLLASCNYVNGSGDAPTYATQWAAENLPPGTQVSSSCMNRDTDHNGYVSCTVTAQYPSASGVEVIPLECGVNRVGTGCGIEGCKLVAPYFRPRVVQ